MRQEKKGRNEFCGAPIEKAGKAAPVPLRAAICFFDTSANSCRVADLVGVVPRMVVERP
jgi:hypothetical protein